jgi:hypothetical protein
MIPGIALAVAGTIALALTVASATAIAPVPQRAAAATSPAAPLDPPPLKLEKLAVAGFDVQHAEAFPAPGGLGFVVRNPATQKICLGIPGTEPGDVGSTAMACDRISAAARRGLSVEIVGDLGVDPGATDVYAFLLPGGAQDARIKTPTGTVPVAVHAGVAAGTLTGRGSLQWTIGGTPQSHFFAGPFQPGKIELITCHSQRTATKIPPAALPTTPAQTQRLMKQLQAKYCR